VLRRGSSHFELAWERPKVINGVLAGYSIAYKGRVEGQFCPFCIDHLDVPGGRGINLPGQLSWVNGISSHLTVI